MILSARNDVDKINKRGFELLDRY